MSPEGYIPRIPSNAWIKKKHHWVYRGMDCSRSGNLHLARYAGWIWKGDVLISKLCFPWGVGDDGRIGNLLEKTQFERGDTSQRRIIYFSNRRWTNQNPWRRSGTENIHLGTASTNSRRKSRYRLSWKIRKVSSTTSRLISGCRWSDEMISGPFRKASFTAITLGRESKLHTPREVSFRIPLWYFDVSRATHTTLDVMQESRVDVYWNIDGSRDLSDSWSGFTQFTLLEENHLDG